MLGPWRLEPSLAIAQQSQENRALFGRGGGPRPTGRDSAIDGAGRVCVPVECHVTHGSEKLQVTLIGFVS